MIAKATGRNITVITLCSTAVDCTGHGVPAALMSMIGNELLNHIGADKNVTSTAQVLSELDIGIKKALKQIGGEEELYEGMDIALCVFTRQSRLSSGQTDTSNTIAQSNGIATLQYAGAYRPLYLIRNGELHEYSAINFSVGGFFSGEKKFNEHNINIQPGDAIYIFSDGFHDQFGGKRGKKFMKKHFKETLMEMQHMSMEEQNEHLNKTMSDWKGDLSQVDDMLVIGIKV